MAKIGELIVKIGADMTSLTKGLEESQKKMQNFGNKAKAIGGTLTAAVTLPLAAAGAAAFKLAADMEDAMGATDQIFAQASDSVKKWADGLDGYYGIAESEALEYANMMGSMLKNIGGLTEEEASKQAATLIELAGDLTAMYGGTTAEAVRALTGALKGNNTMLDNYGMAANDAMVKTKALEMGLYDGTGQMDLATKQAATLALIMEQSAAAQGQAAREAEGASGGMRAFATEVKNLSTDIGQVLLPVITPLIKNLNDIVKKFGDLSPEMKKAIVIVAGLAAALGPVLLLVGSVAGMFASLTTVAAGLGITLGALFLTIGGVAVAVTAAIAIGVLLYKNWDTIMAKARELKQTLVDAYVNTAVAIQIKIKDMIQAGKDFVSGLWQGISSSAAEMAKNIKKWFHDNVIQVAKNVLGIASPSKVMAEIGSWAAKGLALGLGSGSGEVVTQAQLLADAVTSIKQQIQQLNAQYEISYYATGANSDATKQLREQIAELAKQYDALTASIGNAAGVQQKMSLSQTLMSYAGSANSSNADYTAELIKQTITNSKIDWSKEKIGIEIGGRWAPKLPNFDGGGIVPGPIGRPQLAIVHGGEEVRTPQQQQKSGGDVKIDINIYDATDPQKVGQVVESKIKSVFRDLALGGAY